MYITVKQAADKWGISDRRVRTLCSEGKNSGAFIRKCYQTDSLSGISR